MKKIQTSAVRRTTAILAVCGSVISATAQHEVPQKDPETGIQAVSKPKLSLPILFKNPPAAKKQDSASEVETAVETPERSEENSPLLPSTTESGPKVDFADMEANRIKIPALESISEDDLPALLRSEDTGSAAPVGQPQTTVAPASNEVERLRGAESQADSFRAALAVAVGGEDNLPSQPQTAAVPVAVALPEPVEANQSPEAILPEPAAENTGGGFFSRFGRKLKGGETQIGAEPEVVTNQDVEVLTQAETPEKMEEADPVSSEKRGLFSGLFSSDKADATAPAVTEEEIPEAKEKKKLGWFKKAGASEEVDVEEVLETEEKTSRSFLPTFGKKSDSDSEVANEPKKEKSGFKLFKREPKADAE